MSNTIPPNHINCQQSEEKSQNSEHLMGLLNLIDHEEFRTFNINIARKLGSNNAALFLSEMINRYKYHKSRGELIVCPDGTGGWFYYTYDKGLERINLTKHEQDSAIKILIAWDLIEKKTFGLPCKKHFTLNFSGLAKFMSLASSQPVVKKTETGDQKFGNSSYIQEENNKESKLASGLGGKPPVEESDLHKSASPSKESLDKFLKTSEDRNLGLTAAILIDALALYGDDVVESSIDVLEGRIKEGRMRTGVRSYFLGICKKEKSQLPALVMANRANMKKLQQKYPQIEFTMLDDCVLFKGKKGTVNLNESEEEFKRKVLKMFNG